MKFLERLKLVVKILVGLDQVSEHYCSVRKFMALASQRVPEEPSLLIEEEAQLRARLMLEETLETITKGLGYNLLIKDKFGSYSSITPESLVFFEGSISFERQRPQNLVEIVDGCCDVKVVTTGTLIACGVPDVLFQRVVDQNNLDKFGPGGYRDQRGKWIKPKDHQPPPIPKMLKDLGYTGNLSSTPFKV